MKQIAVFFGGNSSEHEISVITGMLAVNLLKTRCRVIPVYLPREGGMSVSEAVTVEEYRVPTGKKFTPVRLEGRTLVHAVRRKKLYRIDGALNCCHGGAGEDGTLPALLSWHGIASASPDMAASAIFMNKEFSQIAARGLGIAVVPSFAVTEEGWKQAPDETLREAETLGYPVIVKPSCLGSSIGVKVARGEEELKEALSLAFRLDRGALVERYLEGKRDINCAAARIGGKILLSPCEEVFSSAEILNFADKYEGEAACAQLPARLPDALAEEIASATRLLYERFHLRGVVRADFLIADGRAYFNELNTVPGSLACYLFGKSLSEARDFLFSLVEEARPPVRKHVVQTGILQKDVFRSKGCKRR